MALGEAEALLLAANAQLQEKQAALAEVQAKVQGLRQALAAAQEESAELRAQASTTSSRLQRAAKLTSGLQEEGVRWGVTAAQLKVPPSAPHTSHCPFLLLPACSSQGWLQNR